jgi:hypothetical protein
VLRGFLRQLPFVPPLIAIRHPVSRVVLAMGMRCVNGNAANIHKRPRDIHFSLQELLT